MADDDRADNAFEEGKAAAERSEPASKNPYTPDSDAHRRWLDGHLSVTEPDEIADDLADFA